MKWYSMSVSGQTASAISNSTSFWFDDGNLVLEVENTRFCVHHGILSLHSSFLKDLSLLPQPVESSEVIEDGTRIVQMPCNQADEWSRMLHVIYNPLQSHESYKEYSLLTIMAMLRLGHKYYFQRLEDLPRSWIENTLPGHEYTFLRVVREVGMHSILPVAHLMCIWNVDNVNTLFDMTQRGNKPQDVELERQDLLSLIGGREAYLHLSVITWYSMMTSNVPYTGCRSVSQCKEVAITLMRKAFDLGVNTTPKVSIAGGVILGNMALESASDLCKSCHHALVDHELCAGEIIWTYLHSYFGLEPPALVTTEG
ncbi:hypothetical protein CPC08DRAFT_311856 [Agrocybe pediades]|nr:hypothetical protein CPC08DRAFT_311856 [Agrocybe pediades]